MSSGPGTPPTQRDGSRGARRNARLVAAALRAGRRSANEAFDRFLPAPLRDVSDRYWTPLHVVRQAAVWLRETQVQTVVDIGSGAGKFCVAAALLTRCHIRGLEHRTSLVTAARALAGLFEVDDRVTFIHGEVTDAAVLDTEAYYVFNPFGTYDFEAEPFVDADIQATPHTRSRDVAAVADLLSGAPNGTVVITYNGFGGPVPSDYVQLDVASHLPGTLRLWQKGIPGPRPTGAWPAAPRR